MFEQIVHSRRTVYLEPMVNLCLDWTFAPVGVNSGVDFMPQCCILLFFFCRRFRTIYIDWCKTSDDFQLIDARGVFFLSDSLCRSWGLWYSRAVKNVCFSCANVTKCDDSGCIPFSIHLTKGCARMHMKISLFNFGSLKEKVNNSSSRFTHAPC